MRRDRCALAVVAALCWPFMGDGQQPEALDMRNGRLIWQGYATSGYHSIEWSESMTGTWSRNWLSLQDIPASPGIQTSAVPMFYRILWSGFPLNPTSPPPQSPIPDASSFSASAGDRNVGLNWSPPVGTNVAAVRLVRRTVWYPSDVGDGETIFYGWGNSHLDLQVTNGIRYYYKLFCSDGLGHYSLGISANGLPTDGTPPSDVGSFSAVPGDHSVSLSWVNPPNADFAGVKIMRSTNSPPTGPTSGSQVYVGPGNNYTDTPLPNNVPQYYKVFAFDYAPNYSPGAATFAIPVNILPPGEVTNVSLTAGDEAISLTWKNPTGGDFTGVRVQRTTGGPPSGPNDGITVYEGSGTNLNNTGLQNGLMYWYRVFSYDEIPNYSSGVTTGGIPADVSAPAQPTGAIAGPVIGGIAVSWSNPANADFAGTRVVRKYGTYPSNAFDGVVIYQGPGTNTVDVPLRDGATTNFYRLYAYDEVPNYSTPASTPFAPPRALQTFFATPGDERVVLTWDPGAGPALSGVRIQCLADRPPTSFVDGITVYQGPASAQSFTNAGLQNLTPYFFSAFTYDATPNFSTGRIAVAIPADTNAPGSPVSLSVLAVTGGIAITWKNPTNGDFAGTRVVRKYGSYPSNASDGVIVYSGPGTNAVDTPLVDSYTTNFYRLFCFDEVPNYSQPLGSLWGPPQPLQTFTAVPLDERISLAWTPGVAATTTGLRIQRSTVAFPTSSADGLMIYNGLSVAQTITNSGLANYTTYYFAAFTYDASPNYSTCRVVAATPLDTSAPENPRMGTPAVTDLTVYLSWTNPVAPDLMQVRLVRKSGSAPSGWTDGTILYEGLATTYVDTVADYGTQYYYRVYASDECTNWSGAGVVMVRPLRLLFRESFEVETGWTSGEEGWYPVFSRDATTGSWTGLHVVASTNRNNVIDGVCSFSLYDGNAYLVLPRMNHLCKLTLWAKARGFATECDIALSFYDGYQWVYGGSRSMVGDSHVQLEFTNASWPSVTGLLMRLEYFQNTWQGWFDVIEAWSDR